MEAAVLAEVVAIGVVADAVAAAADVLLAMGCAACWPEVHAAAEAMPAAWMTACYLASSLVACADVELLVGGMEEGRWLVVEDGRVEVEAAAVSALVGPEGCRRAG